MKTNKGYESVTLTSEYAVGDTVLLKSCFKDSAFVPIIKIKWDTYSKNFHYLVELTDESRKWIAESELGGVVAKEEPITASVFPKNEPAIMLCNDDSSCKFK